MKQFAVVLKKKTFIYIFKACDSDFVQDIFCSDSFQVYFLLAQACASFEHLNLHKLASHDQLPISACIVCPQHLSMSFAWSLE